MSIRIPSLVLLAVLIVFPFPAFALSSKTYSFNSSAAFNYDAVGQISFTDNNSNAAWYNPDWKYRQKLVISKENIVGTQENIEIPIEITDQNAAIFDFAKSDGSDIVFTDSDGVTKLTHAVSNFEAGSSTFNAWVTVRKLTSQTDTILYLYYGNSKPISQQGEELAGIDDDLLAHWKFDEASLPTGSAMDQTDAALDSSGNGWHGSIPGTSWTASTNWPSVNEEVAPVPFNNLGSFLFKKTRSWVRNVSGPVTGSSTSYTLWIKNSNIINTQVILSNYSSSGSNSMLVNFNGGLLFVSAAGCSTSTDATTFSDGGWHHIAVVKDGEQCLVYIDGSNVSTVSAPGNETLGKGIMIGNHSGFDNLGPSPSGNIDDVRVYNHGLAAAEVASLANSYRSQDADIESFVTVNDPVSLHSTAISKTLASGGITSLVTLKKDRPLLFSKISTFKPDTKGKVTYQLSNNAGKTWLFYTKSGWKKANPNNPNHTSSANDIHEHISTFPQGDGKLLWRAYLSNQATLERIKITYTSTSASLTSDVGMSAASSTTKNIGLSHPLIKNINTLFETTYDRIPTAEEWTYWVGRTKDKPTLPELFGAMQWQKLFGN